MTSSRPKFLDRTGGSALGALMAGLPNGWMGTAGADDTPAARTVRFGIIAPSDCAPIVMAHEG